MSEMNLWRQSGLQPRRWEIALLSVGLVAISIGSGSVRLVGVGGVLLAVAAWVYEARPLIDAPGWVLRIPGLSADFDDAASRDAVSRVMRSWSALFGESAPGKLSREGSFMCLTLPVKVGSTPEALTRLSKSLAAAVDADEVMVSVKGKHVTYRWRVGIDTLATPIALSEVPEGDPTGRGMLPIGVTESGEVLSIERHHVLIAAASGSGKGSMLWAVVRAFMPEAREGLVEFVGLDSKRSEVAANENLFRTRGYDAVAHHDILAELTFELDRRASKAGRDAFVPTRECRLIVLVIDELSSMPRIFTDARQRKEAEDSLKRILSQGRSLGILVVAASQEVTKEAMQSRDLFGPRLAGRLANTGESRLFLGDDALEQGARPDEIPMSTVSNDHCSAGVLWARDATGKWVRARVPYTDDAELLRLAQIVGRGRSVL